MELKHVLEAILFAAQKPLSIKELREILRTVAKESEEAETEIPGAKALKRVKIDDVEKALRELENETQELNRTYRLTCVAGSWQYVSKPEFAPWIRALVGEKPKPARLSKPALETLAIVAYRQPLTRSEMEEIRGVAVDGVVSTLVERGLLIKVGTAELPGRPALYGTTPSFLEFFGLGDLDELPAADELRRIQVASPDSLVTTTPDLETQDEDQMTLDQVSEEEKKAEPETSPETEEPKEEAEVPAEPAEPEAEASQEEESKD